MVACLVGSSKQLAMYNAREATKVPLARRETQYGRRRDAQYRRRREVQYGWVERCTDTVRTEPDGIHKFTRSDHWLSVEAAAELVSRSRPASRHFYMTSSGNTSS